MDFSPPSRPGSSGPSSSPSGMESEKTARFKRQEAQDQPGSQKRARFNFLQRSPRQDEKKEFKFDYSSPDWWKLLPCHLCPEWNLKAEGEMSLDVKKLKQRIDWSLEDDPDFMAIEYMLFRAFLEVPPDIYLMKGRSSPQSALKFLKKAEDEVGRIWPKNEDAQNSYKLVINAFRMWLFNDGTFKESAKIDKLNRTLEYLYEAVGSTSTPHTDVVLGIALGKLSPHRHEKAISLLTRATNDPKYGEEKSWLFYKAYLLGRKPRGEHKSTRGRMPDWKRKKVHGEEISILQKLVKDQSDFARARAYLGESLFHANNKVTGLQQLRIAYTQSPHNRDIAVIFGRVLRWHECYEESEKVFKSIKDWEKYAEVRFQLGLLYHQLSKNNSLSRENWRDYIVKASDHVDRAVELDGNHVPALCRKAELHFYLGSVQEAKCMYFDLFRGRHISQEQQYFMRCEVNNKPKLFKIFNAEERLENAYNILLLCTENFVEVRDSTSGRKEFAAAFKLGTTEAMEVIKSGISSQAAGLKLDAMQFLADIMFKLDNFPEANKILTELQEINGGTESKPEMLWMRGKCLCELGKDVAAEEVAKLLQETHGENDKCRELFASIYLMRAKSTSGCSIVADNLSCAIHYGSIEACYVFLTGTNDLPRKVCSVDHGVARILADIKWCLVTKNSHHSVSRKVHVNTDMPVTSVIEESMSDILTYPKILEGLPQLLKTRYELMTSIRNNLVEFEYSFKYVCKGKLGSTCGEIVEKTLTDARNLLDHVIYSYQRAVSDKQPSESKFPIHQEDNRYKPVKDKFNEYLKKYFPKADPPVPERIMQYFLQIQPMSNSDNNWLLALSHYVNNVKHTGVNYENTVELKDKLGRPIKYKKEDLVRISCSRVEAIASTLLEYVQELYDDGKTKPGFLLAQELSDCPGFE